ncbi:hypothetical protein [Oceanicoccus sagamiensis]|nr:hypothetical protein [Oceanicoccus sagamiensis]
MIVQLAAASDDDLEPANYAFSNYIGNGIYRASGQRVTVFNLPFDYIPPAQSELSANDPEATSYFFRLPVSLGFYNFDFDDVIGGDIPNRADTFTFVPGIEWRVPLNERLLISPYIDLGLGNNFSTGEQVMIYSTGVSSQYSWGGNNQHLWVNRLFYAAYRGLSVDINDAYGAMQSGVDYRLPLSFDSLGRRSFFTAYGLAIWNFNRLEFTVPGERAVGINKNYEAGFTYGWDQPLEYGPFQLKRIGIGYRTGDRLKVWRLSFNLPI